MAGAGATSGRPGVERTLVVLAFTACALAYVLLVVPHSFFPSDDGFVLSAAYRVVHGEVPYRDFVYVRPPLTPYLHALWLFLPHDWQFVVARASFYLFYLAMALVLLLVAGDGCLPDRRSLWPVAGVTGVFWAYAMHNFPPMPWTTVDGLLFGTVSLALLASRKPSPTRLALAGLCAGLAPLTKQGFILLVPVVAVAGLVLAWRCDDTGCRRLHLPSLFAVGLGMALPLVVAAGALWLAGGLTAAVRQIGNASDAGSLRQVLLDPYLTGWPGRQIGLVLPWGFGLGCLASLPGNLAGWTGRHVAYAVILWTVVERFSRHADFGGLPWSLVVFAFAGAFVVTRLVILALAGDLRPPTAIVAVGSLILALCAQISLGYVTPLLGLTGVGFAVGVLLAPLDDAPAFRRWPVLTLVPLVLAVGIGIGLCRQRPYLDAPVWRQGYDLATLSPRFRPGISTGRYNYRMMQDLFAVADDLERRYPGVPQVCLTNVPLFAFLTDRRNVMSLDWWQTFEARGETDRLLGELRHRPALLLVDREYRGTMRGDGNRFLALIRREGREIATRGRFQAYSLTDLPPYRGTGRDSR